MTDGSAPEQAFVHSPERQPAPEIPGVLKTHLVDYANNAIERLGTTKVAEIQEYFTAPDPRLRMTPLERIAQTYESLVRPIDTEGQSIFDSAVRLHAQEISGRAFDQQVENPLKFVSHGFDHTLSVVEYGKKILEQNPEFLTAMKEKYGISDRLSEFMLDNLVLFHDTGYRELNGRGKAAHAIAGADIVSNEQVRDMFRSIIRSQQSNIEKETVETILHDFRDAVLFHNADTVQHAFDAKVATTLGEFLVDSKNVVDVISTFRRQQTPAGMPREVTTVYVQSEEMKAELEHELTEGGVIAPIQIEVIKEDESKKFHGRVLDLASKGDEMIGLEFHDIDLTDTPFQAYIRLADNMDISPERLSVTQKEAVFKEICQRFGNGEEESQVLKKLENFTATAAYVARRSNSDAMLAFAENTDLAKELIVESFHLDVADEHAVDEMDEKMRAVTSPAEAEALWKEIIIDRILQSDQFSSLPGSEKETMRSLVMVLDSWDFRYFGGYESIVTVRPTHTGVTIVLNKEKYEGLNNIRVSEDVLNRHGDTARVPVGVGEYQVWRLQQAYKSIHINGKPIEISLVDEDGHVITRQDTL